MRSTVLIVDNVDIDNPLAVLAACHQSLGLNVKAVIVTGRTASRDPNADISYFDPDYSEEVRIGNTRRMKGLLMRHNINVPVFDGLTPAATVVPHHLHINEYEHLDLWGDWINTPFDGRYWNAVEFLAGLNGPIDLIVGGPLTEAWQFVQDPQISPKLGNIVCQLGLFRFAEIATVAGGGVTFNAAGDRLAMERVIRTFRGQLFMVPTDVTKLPAVGFDHPDDLQRIGMDEEVLALYRVFYEQVLVTIPERIYPHDVHAVFLMAQLHGFLNPLYSLEEVNIQEIGPKGQIVRYELGSTSQNYPRYVATSVDAGAFTYHLRATTCASVW